MDSVIPEDSAPGEPDDRPSEDDEADLDQPDEARFGSDPSAPRPRVYARPIAPDLIDADAVKVIRRLRRHGHVAYLVGGGVRDLLLGKKPKDFDVATSARPAELRHLFRNCRIIGRRFRLAHILFGGGKVIETATFRRDPMQVFDEAEGHLEESVGRPGETPPRGIRRRAVDEETDLLIRHDNVFGEPHEDAIRRDFTINGLFYDIDRGEVIDYVGGMPDLERRVVRTIGEPDVRFREDPIRILRAIKFSARLDLGLDPDLYDAMVEHRGEIERAAKPRVLEEILRLLRGGAAHRSVYLAWDTGVLSVVLPAMAFYLDDDAPGSELTWGRLAAIDRRFREGRLPSDAVLLTALLLGPAVEAMEDVDDPIRAFDEFLEEPSELLLIPRRIRERMRLIVHAQRRLASGKLGALPRRDFFLDAATLYALDEESRGRELPEWAADPSSIDGGSATSRRRRRRRRRVR